MGDAAGTGGQLSLGAVATRGSNWQIGQQVIRSEARYGQGGIVLIAAGIASSYSDRICRGFNGWKEGFARYLLVLQLKEQGSNTEGMLFDCAACHCELC